MRERSAHRRRKEQTTASSAPRIQDSPLELAPQLDSLLSHIILPSIKLYRISAQQRHIPHQLDMIPRNPLLDSTRHLGEPHGTFDGVGVGGCIPLLDGGFEHVDRGIVVQAGEDEGDGFAEAGTVGWRGRGRGQ